MKLILYFLLFLVTYPVIVPVFAPVYAEAQYQLPQSKEYWKFHNWYKEHSVLSLIISADDNERVKSALKELEKLREKGVLIGDIMLVATKEDKDQAELFRKYGQAKINSARLAIKNFSVKNSPTWIVRYRNKNYVYEGLKFPSRIFSSTGEFRP